MKSDPHVLKQHLPLFTGIIAGTGLAVFYILLLALIEPGAHVTERLSALWYWILLLSAGFGIQAGLFITIRRIRKNRGTTALAASGGASAGAMAACCAHHLADILPILGLSAAAVFLSRYQIPFILIGVLSNLIGILTMLAYLQKSGLSAHYRLLYGLSGMNLRSVRNVSAGVSAVVISLSFILTSGSVSATEVADTSAELQSTAEMKTSAQGSAELQDTLAAEGPQFPRQTDARNGVAVSVQPVDYRKGFPLQFEIGFNTHQGNLDFQLTDIAIMTDDLGNIYKPLDWNGSGPGGHHRSGILVLPPPGENATEITLVLKNVYDIPERLFSWKLGQ